MWAHQFAPTRKHDLGVHPKKIQEVDLALTELHPVVVLLGPPGCCKETTLRVLCAERGWGVVEWECPPDGKNVGDAFLKFIKDARSVGSAAAQKPHTASHECEPQGRISGDAEGASSIIHNTPNAQKNSSSENLNINGRPHTHNGRPRQSGHVVMVKDIPFTLWDYREGFATDFHHALGLLSPNNNNNSSSSSSSSSSSYAFPIYFLLNDNIHVRLIPQAHVITFNPVAPTIMTKALERIMKCAGMRPHPSKSELADTVQASQGDLRSAINTLQVGFTFSSSASSGVSGTGTPGRLGFFHAIGRLMYCKRLLPDAKEPKQLSYDQMTPKENRPPLYFEVEEVMQDSGATSQSIVDFCFTNAPHFFESIEDLAAAQTELCRPTFFQEGVLDNLSHEVALRGMLDANMHPCKPTTTGLFQFIKPHARDVLQLAEDRQRVLQPTFGPRAAETSVPFLHKILSITQGKYPALAQIPPEYMILFQALHTTWENSSVGATRGKRMREEDNEVILPPQVPLVDDIEDFSD